MEDCVLAIDCGTQSLRALLVSRGGRLLGQAKVAYQPYLCPRPGWAEQDARVYWDALCTAVGRLKAGSGADFAGLRAVGVTALRDTPVLVDADGEPLAPAILWLDTRKAALAYRPPWAARVLMAATGLLQAADRAQEDCKATWLRQNRPELWVQAAKVLQVSGFLNHRLTGRFRDSVACQAGHLPFHYREQRWCRPWELNARLFPMEARLLPDLVQPGLPLGRVTQAAAACTGIPAGLPVIACAADKAAEAVGTGSIEPGSASLSLGTSATVQAASRRYFEPLPRMPALPSARPGHYCPEIQVFRGYWLVQWFLREFGPGELEEGRRTGVAPESLLDRLLQATPPGALGLVTLPHWHPGLGPAAARGALIGLDGCHSRSHVYRSLIEGLAFALRSGLERLEAAGGRRFERVAVAGGASQSRAICQITADILGRPLCAGETWEGSALGAAVLTAAGAGLHPGLAEAVRAMVRTGPIYRPRPREADLYRRMYQEVHQPAGPRLRCLHERIRRVLEEPACPGAGHRLGPAE
jgi:sugar (pentulose or hexulose) kinase